MELYKILEKELKKEPNYISDNGELKKWVVINKAQNFDQELIELLLDNAELKEKFFVKVKNVVVFNQNHFIRFLEQKNYLNDSYTQYKNKVGLTIDGKYLKQRNEVALVWPFKDCILEGGQSREENGREEIFFNEILAQDEITQLLEPKVLTNAKRISAIGEKKLDKFNRNENGTILDNLIIKGNNLLTLHTLKEEFTGKVKLIYIDPPYNPQTNANTFAYNNSFNHSSWLTFMKNRASIAKSLLCENGIFACAIDHYELFYLGALLDEIFGIENRVGVVAIVHNPGGRQDDKFFPTAHENMLVYAKNKTIAEVYLLDKSDEKLKEFILKDKYGKYKLRGFRRSGNNSNREDGQGLYYSVYYNKSSKKISLKKEKGFVEILPIDDNGNEKCWRWGKDTFLKKYEKYIEVKEVKGKYDIYVKERENDYHGEKAKTFWLNPKYSGQSGTQTIKSIFGNKEFTYPKSMYLMKDIVKIFTKDSDIIIDYHAGSGTTAHAVLELNKQDGGNRQIIVCEQMDYVETVTVKRVKKVIEQNKSGDFIYFELKKYNENFINQIESAKNSKELLEIWKDMKEKSFLNYNVDIKEQDGNIEEFKALSIKEQKLLLCELLDKNQLYVNLSSLNDGDFKCTEEEKKITKDFYQIKN